MPSRSAGEDETVAAGSCISNHCTILSGGGRRLINQRFKTIRPKETPVRMIGAILAAAAVAEVAGCGTGDSHRPQSRSDSQNLPASYVTACEQKADATMCHCVRTHINARVSRSAFGADQTSIDRRGTFPRYWLDAIPACRRTSHEGANRPNQGRNTARAHEPILTPAAPPHPQHSTEVDVYSGIFSESALLPGRLRFSPDARPPESLATRGSVG